MLGCPCCSKGVFARSLVRSNGLWDREESPDRSPEQLASNRCPGCPVPREIERGSQKIPCSALRAGLLLPWCVGVLTGSVAGMSRQIDIGSQDREHRGITMGRDRSEVNMGQTPCQHGQPSTMGGSIADHPPNQDRSGSRGIRGSIARSTRGQSLVMACPGCPYPESGGRFDCCRTSQSATSRVLSYLGQY